MSSCIVLMGAGRSGTSLAMKLLSASGMRLSERLVPASVDNPDGHFEDARIVEVQQTLMNAMGLIPHLPRPQDWADRAAYPQARQQLRALIEAEVARQDAIWGFKDPRTCITWPLWQEVFALTGVMPLVVFCVRDGQAVVHSMMTAYGLPQDHAEAIYLYRSLHALEDVSEGWFFVRYRDWFDNAQQQLMALTGHCGLSVADAQAVEILAANLRPDLDRHRRHAGLRLSGVVHELDDMLSSFSGTDYDRARITAWCASLRRRLSDVDFLLEGIRRQAERRPETHPSLWQRLQRKR